MDFIGWLSMVEKMNGVIVGAGNFANFLLQRFKGKYGADLSTEVGDIWLIDPSEKMLAEKGEEYGIPPEKRLKDKSQLEAKVDFAAVVTPASTHLETTAPWLAEGVPTFLAKPLDADYENARKLIELAEQHGTINATGSQMLLHPAFVKAMQYINENNLNITQVQINWNKERGPRNHPIPGITTEEGPHPFGILAVLKQTLPSSVFAVERRGEIIIDPEKWANYTDRPDIVHKGTTPFKDAEYVLAEISKASTATIVYKDGAIALVQNDFEDPLKQRTVHIVGELPEGERFQRSVAIDVDLTDVRPKDQEHAPYIRNGIRIIKGCTDVRSGMGYVLLDEEVKGAEDINAQLKAFLDYARTGEKPEALMTFSDESRAEKLVETVLRSINLNRELRYADRDYV
jgi:predicted dehydrogenase